MNRLNSLVPSAVLALAMAGISGVAAAQDIDVGNIDDIIVVRGALVPDEKRQSPEIANTLDAEGLIRIGDSDIAGALRRVTGVSITGGKFPVARGLNERYSAVTLNGVPIPSPEPLRRAAPLDIIPTSVIGGTLAQKTFSPQFSGEFGGAAIDLQTIARPAEDFLTVSVGFTADTETTMRDGLFYEGSNSDVFGWDDGLRDLTAEAQAVINTGTVADQTALDLSFDQTHTLLITKDDVPANGKGSVTFGKIFDFDSGASLGSTTYVGYDNSWQNREGSADRNDAFASGIRIDTQPQEFTFRETRQNVQLNALNTTAYQSASGDHEIALTTYLLRDTLKRARLADLLQVRDVGDDPLRQENTDWLERQVWQAQLNGNHLFPDLHDLEANWRLAYGEAERDAPYERKTTRQYKPSTGEYLFFNDNPGSNTLIFSGLKDQNFFGAVDFTLPIMWGQNAIDLKFGGSYTDNSRDTTRNIFSVNEGNQVTADLSPSRIDLIYDPVVLETDIIDFTYSNTPQEPDSSSGSLEVAAAYAMANIEFTSDLSASVGVRFEDGKEGSSTQLTAQPDTKTTFDDIKEDYLLPAVTVTWRPGDWQIRGGFSQTIARPQFRELVFTDFLDLDYDVILRGNPFLQNAELDNYDIRAEYFFGRGQFVTIGAFYKEITNPIEQFKTTGEDEAFSFVNAPAAEIYGVEAEFQKRFMLDDMFENDWFIGKELLIGTNYTYSDSKVKVGAGDTVILAQPEVTGVRANPLQADTVIRDGRPLVGQSDHLFNFQIGVEAPDSNTKATLLVNYASERVLFAEANATPASPPAIVEKPPLSLDFVFSQDIEIGGGTYGLGLKAQNLLGEKFQATRTDAAGTETPFLEYDRGTKYSISLKRQF